MRHLNPRTAITFGSVLLIAVYYWRFTHVSLQTGFSHDDLMNLFFAWREPFSDVIKANFFVPTNVIRPFGAFFYASFYHWFGFDGFPYRVLCYLFLWANLGVTYLFVRDLIGSREVAILSVLLHCHQANLFGFYYGSGCCYDVFAYFFYFLAFWIVVREWRAGRVPGWGASAGVAGLFSCAVNSKEAAASLPILLLVFVTLQRRPKSLSWIWVEARPVLVTGCVGLLYLWARFTGSNNLLDHPDYTPAFTLARYLESTAAYLRDLSCRTDLGPGAAGLLLLGLTVMAVLLRSRHLWFSWALIVIGSAPVAFVTPRGIYAYYIPLLGYAMFAAILLTRLRDALIPSRPLAAQCALFLIMYAGWWRWQSVQERHLPEYWNELATIETAASQFRARPEWFRPKSSLLITSDAFPGYEWASSFIALLIANDKSVQVHTLVKLDPRPTKEQIARYTTVIGLRNGVMVEIDRSRLP